MRAALSLIALAACRSPAAKPPPEAARDADALKSAIDDAAATAVAARASVVLPTFVLGEHTYVEISAWFELPEPEPPELVAWGAGAVARVPVDATSMAAQIQAATAASVPWPSVVGTALPAYQADGRACDATITGLYLLGYGYGDELSDGSDGYDGGASLIAELEGAAGCAPVLITNRSGLVFFVPASPPSASEHAALATAFRAIAKPLGVSDPPTIQLYQRAGSRVAMVTLEVSPTKENGCGAEYDARRAIFHLDATDQPRLASQTRAYFGDAPVIAVFDSDNDGLLEATLGAARFDGGGSGTLSLASYLAFSEGADPEEEQSAAYELAFGFYIGCD